MTAAQAYKRGHAAAVKEVLQVLSKDRVWHRKNPGVSHCGPSFEGGFITGLAQAQRLVRRIRRSRG